MLFARELLNAHRDNLGTMVKLVIFNELSNARNPNNMQVLHTVLQHSPEQAPKVRLDSIRVTWKQIEGSYEARKTTYFYVIIFIFP